MAEKMMSRIKKSITPAPKNKAAEPAPTVSIDYPREGDLVLAGHYAVRISAKASGSVQICVNKGDWSECRNSGGFFWYDWWPAKAGKYTLTARVQIGKGTPVKSDPRACTVVSNNGK